MRLLSLIIQFVNVVMILRNGLKELYPMRRFILLEGVRVVVVNYGIVKINQLIGVGVFDERGFL